MIKIIDKKNKSFISEKLSKLSKSLQVMVEKLENIVV